MRNKQRFNFIYIHECSNIQDSSIISTSSLICKGQTSDRNKRLVLCACEGVRLNINLPSPSQPRRLGNLSKIIIYTLLTFSQVYTDKNERRMINSRKRFITPMNPLIYFFFVYQYHKPFYIPLPLIYPKRIFRTLQSDELLRVYQQLYTLKQFINFINSMNIGLVMCPSEESVQ